MRCMAARSLRRVAAKGLPDCLGLLCVLVAPFDPGATQRASALLPRQLQRADRQMAGGPRHRPVRVGTMDSDMLWTAVGGAAALLAVYTGFFALVWTVSRRVASTSPSAQPRCARAAAPLWGEGGGGGGGGGQARPLRSLWREPLCLHDEPATVACRAPPFAALARRSLSGRPLPGCAVSRRASGFRRTRGSLSR